MVRNHAEIVSATPAQRTWRGWRSAPTPTTAAVTTVDVLTGAPTTVEPRITAAAEAGRRGSRRATAGSSRGSRAARPGRRRRWCPAEDDRDRPAHRGRDLELVDGARREELVTATPIAFCPSFDPSVSATPPPSPRSRLARARACAGCLARARARRVVAIPTRPPSPRSARGPVRRAPRGCRSDGSRPGLPS